MLARWESQLGCLFPRPVVFAGDLGQPDLGLNEESLRWVRANCHSILHSAASLSFEVDQATGEPWRSNYEGTRHVLEFARRVGIGQFHHVSTAYVCGLRTGTIYEREVDEGQTLGNAYEQSKLSAEKLVRDWEGLDRVTIYRPAIIVGDSQTGYTTTYHGFYTPLKVVHSLIGKVAAGELNIPALLRALGLSGQERKNFVPVDWVSSVIAHILSDRSLHGRTYHLTPGHRVPVDEMTAAMSEAIGRLSVPASGKRAVASRSGTALDEVFRTQMQTYQAYWRDDPWFDASNTKRAAPHLPCPKVDRAMMGRLSQYAIENNFGWPVPPPLPAPLDIQSHLDERLAGALAVDPPAAADARWGIALQVSGPGGGEWTLQPQDDGDVHFAVGCADDALPRAYMSSYTFGRLLAAETTGAEAMRHGALLMFGAGDRTEFALRAIDRVIRRGWRPAPSDGQRAGAGSFSENVLVPAGSSRP